MNTKYTHIQKIIENRLSGLSNNQTQYIFAHVEDSKIISKHIEDNVLQEIENHTHFTVNLTHDSYNDPYCPFLSFIKHFYSNSKEKKILKSLQNAGVYNLHIPIFYNYLCNNKIKRNEDILIEELEFEIEQIYFSIIKILDQISNEKPAVLIINDLHFASESTLKLIKFILNKFTDGKVMFIFLLDIHHENIVNDTIDMWFEFITDIENQIFMIKSEKNQNTDKSLKLNEEINIEQQIRKIRNCIDFFAFNECQKSAIKIYNYIQLKKTKIPDELYLELLLVLGDVHFYLKENDTALFYYNMLLDLAQEKKETWITANVFRKIGYIYFLNGNISASKKLLDQSIMLGRRINNKTLYFKSYFILLLINYKIKNLSDHNSLSQLYQNIKQIIPLGRKLKLKNMLCVLWEIMGKIQGFLYDVNLTQLEYFDHSIKIALDNDNKYRLASSFEKKGLIYTYLNEIDRALECYIKSNEITVRLEKNIDIARSFNSIGNLYHIIEDYSQAIDYYYRAFDLLKVCNNFNEVIITIYNIAQVYFCARQFEKAIEHCEMTIKVMKSLNIDEAGIYTLNEIYTLTAICYLKINNIAKAFLYYYKISERKYGDEEYVFELLSALIASEESNYSLADQHFQNMQDILRNKNKKYFIKKYSQSYIIIYYYEYGLMLKKSNNNNYLKQFKIGLIISDKYNYKFYKNLFLKEIPGEEYTQINFNFKNFQIDFNSILSLITQEIKLQKQKENLHDLHKKINEINFLNNLQKILGRSNSKEQLITDVADLIHHSILVELTFIYLADGKEWKCYYSSKPPGKININLIEFVKEHSANHKARIICDISVSEEYAYLEGIFSSFMIIPLYSRDQVIGSILCANQQKELHLIADDLRIMSIAAQQVTATLEKIVLIEKLKEIDKIKSQFFSNISHELRTPLTLILSPIETIIQGHMGPTIPSNHEYINSVYKNTLRLLKMINNLLDFSKIEAGKMKARIVKININTELKYIVTCLKAATDAKKIDFRYIHPNYDVNLYADKDMFEKIVMNLLANSFKFTPRDGRIILEVYEEDDSVCIQVTDTGCGIPADKMDRIFDKFMQVGIAEKRENEGTGLGLSLVKQLVELHRGNVCVESELNKGTSIIVKFLKGFSHFPGEFISPQLDDSTKNINYLNLIDFEYQKENFQDEAYHVNTVPDEKHRFAISENFSFESVRGASVLIVEDNLDLLNYLSSLLGYVCKIYKARNGKEGLEKAREFHPDLIISDIMMPLMSGYELCRAVKKDDFLTHTPIILITAKTEVSMKIKGFEYGADAYIGKPFNPQELMAKVYSMLRLRKHQKHLAKKNIDITEEKDKIEEVNARLIEINMELDKYSRTDILTSLSNRRDFTEKINYEASRANRNKESFSLLMCDLDYFKSVNDNYGHDCGDHVLKYISAIFRDTLREQDVIARWGGEEFIVMLPGTDLGGAKGIAEKLREKIAAEQFEFEENAFYITISIGVSVYKSNISIEKCIKLADESLYIAKEAGRNQVVSLDG